ncbi:hypothetical protein Goshw_000634, partial [Gossypium schwendimanii]|nr:hypothetical protein [Gossypium schwendimanii]
MSVVMGDAFGPWMVVEHKSRRNQTRKQNQHARSSEENPVGNRFV